MPKDKWLLLTVEERKTAAATRTSLYQKLSTQGYVPQAVWVRIGTSGRASVNEAREARRAVAAANPICVLEKMSSEAVKQLSEGPSYIKALAGGPHNDDAKESHANGLFVRNMECQLQSKQQELDEERRVFNGMRQIFEVGYMGRRSKTKKAEAVEHRELMEQFRTLRAQIEANERKEQTLKPTESAEEAPVTTKTMKILESQTICAVCSLPVFGPMQGHLKYQCPTAGQFIEAYKVFGEEAMRGMREDLEAEHQAHRKRMQEILTSLRNEAAKERAFLPTM